MRWETIPGGGLTSQYWLLSHYMRIYIDSGSCFKDVKPHYITERTQKVKKVPILLQKHWVPILKVWGPHFECLRSPLKLWTVLSTIWTPVSLISFLPMFYWSTDPSHCRHSWTHLGKGVPLILYYDDSYFVLWGGGGGSQYPPKKIFEQVGMLT